MDIRNFSLRHNEPYRSQYQPQQSQETKFTRYVPKVSGPTYKSRTKWKNLRGIYSAIYGEVNVSVSVGYVLQYAGGTRASSCFIYVNLKIWSGPKRLDTTTYLKVGQPDVFQSNSYVIKVALKL
jgi:hypothetical protein